MQYTGLVLLLLGVLLCARHRDRLDFGLDCGDVGFVRWYPNADTDSHTNSNSNANTNANTNTNANANANTNAN